MIGLSFVVGARITVSNRLTNLTNRVIQLEYTFIGVRDPNDENRDEEVDAGISLGPEEWTDVRQTFLLDRAGGWTIWPRYALPGDVPMTDARSSFPWRASGRHIGLMRTPGSWPRPDGSWPHP